MINHREEINPNLGRYKYPLINTYDLTGEYGIGYTVNTNEQFFFDLEDYDLIKIYRWKARHRNGRDADKYYIEDKIGEKRIHLHHLVMRYDDIIDNNIPIVDHINRDTYDCRKENLRESNFRINNINKDPQKSNTSGVIGVNYNKSNNKWVARISLEDGTRKWLYQGKDFQKAVIKRLLAEKEYYMEYAPQKHLFEQYGIGGDMYE